MTCKLTGKTRVLTVIVQFFAVLTVLTALAALAQSGGAGQPSEKASALPASLSVRSPLLAQNHPPLLGVGSPDRPGASSRQSQELGGFAPASGASLFLPAVTYGSGGAYAWSVAVADVNGDGKPDLLVANEGDGTVGVLLGNGDGTFRSAVTYGSGGLNAFSVAATDVNGDGKPDLLVANSGSNTVGVLLGNGDGTFRPGVTYDSGGLYAVSVAVADVNGDRKPDLVVANLCGSNSNCENATVGVLLGNGDGTFQGAVTYNSGGIFVASVAVADVSGDGKPDLVAGNYDSGTVGVLLGIGDGAFQQVVTYGSGGTFATSVAVADVNGDGKPDLLVARDCASPRNCTVAGVGVLLGNGGGTVQPAVTYHSGGTYAASVAVADVNADGKPDLLVVNGNNGRNLVSVLGSVGVLLGNGDGTFQRRVIYGSGGWDSFANNPTSVAVADVNGDGGPDILVANQCISPSCAGGGSVGVLLNNARGKSSISLASTLNPSIYGQAVTLAATVTSFGAITPIGTVKFMWSGNILGSVRLNSNGVASLTRSNLNAGSYPLTAVYSGSTTNLGSASAVLNQVVQPTTSAATISSSPNPSTQGQAVTFTATITSPTVIPKGSVTFTARNTVLGTAQLSNGKARLTISSLPLGRTKIIVTYSGNSNIAGSSASVIQMVQH